MTQKHKLVPCEPTQEMLDSVDGEIGCGGYNNCGLSVKDAHAKAVWAHMLESAPEVSGDAVDMDENTAKRFRGILSLLGISAPESEESLMLCQFSLLGMVRHKIQQIYDQPDRTAQLEQQLGDMEKLYNETMLERDIAALYSHRLEADKARLLDEIEQLNRKVESAYKQGRFDADKDNDAKIRGCLV